MVVSSPQLLKTWADTEDEKTVVAALKDIEFCARFHPNSSMLECHASTAATARLMRAPMLE